MCFDNVALTLQNINASAIDVINPPMDNEGNYIYEDEAYGPSLPYWSFNELMATDFYLRISGAQRLSNGNTLICEGAMVDCLRLRPMGKSMGVYQSGKQ